MSARQRKYEIERMEACDVPHKSRDRDLRATFRADQSENAAEPTVNSAISPGSGISNARSSSPATIPSAAVGRSSRRHGIVGIEQLYDREHLHPAPFPSPRYTKPAPTDRFSKHIVACPPFSTKEQWEEIRAEVPMRFANAETLPPAPTSVPPTALVQQETLSISHEALIDEAPEINRSNRSSYSSHVQSIQMRRSQVYQHEYRQGSTRTDSVTDSDNGEAHKRRERKYTVVNQTTSTRSVLSDCDTDTESPTTESPDRPAPGHIALGQSDGPRSVLSDCITDTDSNTTEKRNRRGAISVAFGRNDQPRLVLSDCDTESRAGSDTTEVPDRWGLEHTTPWEMNTPRSPLGDHATDVATTRAPNLGNKVPINSRLLLKKSSKDLRESTHHLSTWNETKVLPEIAASGRSGLRKAKSWFAEKIQGRNEPPVSAEEAAKRKEEAEKAAAAKKWAKERMVFDRAQAAIARATFALEEAAADAALRSMGPGPIPGCCDPECKLACCRRGR